ncbi:MAG TPA: antibiotic biosynthesis monooxygenase [Spirochaetota bacterium]|nr:antibiotic biosynthesis monooxygenase [Spirochaetota bacterium]HQE59056.1 antibiotic biosynthesis monooxygenase [Spirochaetota bacterium]
MSNIFTEIVEFVISANISQSEFIDVVNLLENEFHSKMKGFRDTELLKGKKDNEWIMIQHWDSFDDCKAAVHAMMKSETTEKFREAIIPQSVKMTILERCGYWKVN